MNLKNSLWTEKYRPQQLDEYVGSDDVKIKIKNWLQQGDIPSLLFYGPAGTGKTTLAKIIAKQLDSDVLYINASDENSIDTLRDKIKGFSATAGFSKWKIVILDECLKMDTLVHVLRDGSNQLVEIQDLDDVNDLVLSYDIINNKEEYQPFKLKNNGDREIIKIHLENGEIIECTSNHKWFVYDNNDNIKVVTTDELYKYNHVISPV